MRVGAGGRGGRRRRRPLRRNRAPTFRPVPTGCSSSTGLKPGQVYDLSVFGGAGLGPQKRGVVAPAANVEIVRSPARAASRARRSTRDRASPSRTSRSRTSPTAAAARSSASSRAARARQTGIGQKRDFNTEDGAFTLEDVPAGTWTVVVEAKGYQEARVANLVVEENGVEGRRRGARDAGRRPQGPRHGRAHGPSRRERRASRTSRRGAAGRAASGASEAAAARSRAWTAATTSRATRRATSRSRASASGRLKVTAKSPDYTDGSEVADVKETGGTVEIKLTAGGSASGVVVSGEPAARERAGRARGRGRRGLRPHPRRRPDDDDGRHGPLPLRPPRSGPLQRCRRG